jgi:hypothetical protein
MENNETAQSIENVIDLETIPLETATNVIITENGLERETIPSIEVTDSDGTHEHNRNEVLEAITNEPEPEEPEETGECYHCGDMFPVIELHELDQFSSTRWVCDGCYEENYFTCDACGEELHNDSHSNDGRCYNCDEDEDYNDDNDSDYSNCNRKYHEGDELVTQGLRAYSFEIECYYKENNDLRKVAEKVDERIGITTDGSLNSDGKEFITPKLSGTKGSKALKELTNALVDNNFYVDRTCGLHMHIDAKDFRNDIETLQNIFMFYMIFEPVIYSFLPYSRRSNSYCMPLEQFYNQKEIMSCQSVEELETIWYREQDYEKKEERKKEKYDQSRYAGVNFHSIFSKNNLEIRHHSGTLDYEKINMWKELHLAIVESCRIKEIETVVQESTGYTYQIKESKIKIHQIIDSRKVLELSLRRDKMFELLQLEPKTQKYFLARNKKFSKELTDNNETLCAE